MNKRGSWTSFLVILAAIFVIVFAVILVAWFLNTDIFGSWSGGITVDKSTVGLGEILGTPWGIMTYIVGGVPQFLLDSGVSDISAVVITFSIFLMIFLTFGDIMYTFGTFNKAISWIVAFLLSIIIANLKGVVVLIAFFTGILGVLGGAAVFVGLGTAFVAFLLVNFGIKSAGPWLMSRRIMMEATKSDAKTYKEALKIGSAAKALKKIGEDIAEG